LLLRLPELETFVARRGAEAGRLLMRAIGETLSNTVRNNDLAGRWSENEFLMILADCDGSNAPWIAERITSVANAATIRWWGEQLSAPVSFGVATAQYGDSLEFLIDRARISLEQGCRAAGAAGT
jgi:diguanylate cyclase (GGDEF)-like protein